MNFVEKEAGDFYLNLYNNSYDNNLENLNSSLESKLSDFKRDRDKLDFLKVLRKKSIEEKKKHIENGCIGCSFEKEHDIGIFVIEQVIDSINDYYSFEPKSDDTFTIDDESELHSKLNDILERLEKQHYGQQVIFDEIEELKDHFNLGKKNWFQLAKGKLMDIVISKALSSSGAQEIYTDISKGFEEFEKYLE